jgi:TonB-linked SusC/RagA family outer membrane protein
MGYTTREIPVGDRREISIALEEDTKQLEEVVVVGYGTQKKSVVTAAISRVTSNDLDLGTPTTVQNALKGKVSGVQITSNSGAPGGDAKVRIRGIGSVNNSEPLYIIDGMPSSNGINYLNPSDIESVEVLKDAASAAIYGARGANGVILVTTKGGKSGKAIFNYEFSYGIQNPGKKVDLMNSSEYQMIMNEMGKNSGRGDNYYFPKASSINIDWQDELTYNNAPIMNHRFSVSGGNDRSTYYASFGIVDQNGIFAKGYADYKRYNARINYTNNLLQTESRNWLNKIVLGVRAGYSRQELIGSNIGNSEAAGVFASMNMLAPTESIYQDDPAKIAEYQNQYPNYVTSDDGRVYNIIEMNEIVNPFASMKVRNNQRRMPQMFNGNFDLKFDILPGLTYKTTADFEWSFSSNRQVTPAYDLNANNRNASSNVYNEQNQSYTWQWENVVQYANSFGNHNIAAMVGTTLASSFNQNINGTRYDLVDVDIDKGFLDISGAPQGDSRATLYGGANDHKLASIFGRVGYNYDERYMAEFTIRRDGSSNFSKNHKYAAFPSVSAGWVLTRESWLQSRPSWFDFAKVRVSWGQNGNEDIQALRYRPLMTTGNLKAVVDNTIMQGAKPNGYYNPNLKWETSEQTDIGIDLRFFKSLNITVDYFDKKTKDMLCEVSIPDYLGYRSIWDNKGTVSNKGWEFDASYKFRAGDVNLGVGANASYVKNVVTEQGDSDVPVAINGLGGGLGGSVTWRANGEPFGFFYGYVHDGIFQNQGEVDASSQDNAKAGDIRWKDLDGKPGITGDDRTNIGNPIPSWTYGLNLNAEWKSIDLSLFFQGSQGNRIYRLYRRNNIVAANFDRAWLGRWTGEGTSDWYPQVVEGGQNGPNAVSSFYVENGSYFRLKILQLGYTLPQHISNKVLISRLRLYVQGENLFTITDYTGLDPEVGTRNGFDGGTYPQARIFSFGLNLTF